MDMRCVCYQLNKKIIQKRRKGVVAMTYGFETQSVVSIMSLYQLHCEDPTICPAIHNYVFHITEVRWKKILKRIMHKIAWVFQSVGLHYSLVEEHTLRKDTPMSVTFSCDLLYASLKAALKFLITSWASSAIKSILLFGQRTSNNFFLKLATTVYQKLYELKGKNTCTLIQK